MLDQSQKDGASSTTVPGAVSFMSELLAESRARCEVNYRLDRSRRAGPNLLTPGELRSVSEPLELLTRIARPELCCLLARLAPADYVVVLSDADGVAIDFVSSGEPDRKLWRMGVCAGATWGETHVGTNGIGTSIMTRSPIIVHQRNHFLHRYAELTCTAAPLFDAQGRVIATLDASSVANLPHEVQGLVLDLVVQTARRIERLYFLEKHRSTTILTVDPGAGSLKTQPVFMLAVGEDGCVIDIQGNTDDGSDAVMLQGLHQKNLSAVLEVAHKFPSDQTSADYVERRCVISLTDETSSFAVLRTPAKSAVSSKFPLSNSGHRRARRGLSLGGSLTLERLTGRDPVLIAHAERIRKLPPHRLPFLIQGETGTGKEEFARAIHAQGQRARGPFVAIDCSSIPENLIESELFGYEAGTFTGGRREGKRGRILDANGGTLLLDEIGDMPLNLQTRLLRVLAQNEVIPLGGHQPIKVDFNLICATHQDLKKLVAQGKFRQDLYFRVAGYRLALPPLRARSDKESIIRGALDIEVHAAGMHEPPKITPPALRKLMEYSWPGNMRELRLALRFAVTTCRGHEIEIVHLPSDLNNEAFPSPESECNGPTSIVNLTEALQRNEWSVTRVAKELLVSRQTVHRWMKAHNLKRPTR